MTTRRYVTFPDSRSTFPAHLWNCRCDECCRDEADDYTPGFIDGAPLPETVAAVYGT